MEQLRKMVQRQDAFFKLSPSSSNETSINLSTEVSNLISQESGKVIFRIFREDFIKAIGVICNLLPLYFKRSNPVKADSANEIFDMLWAEILKFFGNNEQVEYEVYHFKRDDNRYYLNQLSVNGFNLRHFLIEAHSVLRFIKTDDKTIDLRLESYYNSNDINIDELIEEIEETHNNDVLLCEQIIYYGAPGTGKSFKVENREGESEEDRIRTTFHPDTDYSSFVGCYKPVPKEDDPDKITYRFIGQCFTKAYIEAWKRYVAPQDGQNRNFTLVIEEINRGNCAQIFGDIFQLLDRNGDGFSQYTISPDVDLTNFLAEQFDKIKEQLFEQGFEKIADGIEMKLPPNLSIIATMNTSDQSLFPIDSAFKRRWDWEYIPIQYSPIDDVTKETIANKINIKGTTYDWGEFIKAVNERIYQLTKSEDKELGYFFVRPDDGIYITMQRFVSKVIFYLWSDIYKDYAGRENSIFKFSEDSNGKNKIDHSFNSFFNEKEINVKLVKMFIEQFVGTDNAADAKMKYKVNGGTPVGGRRIAVEAMKKYVEKFRQQTPQQVLEQWNTLGISVSHFVETEDVFQSRTDTPRSELITWGENNKIYVTTNGWVYNTNEQYKVSTIKQLVEAINSKEDWGIKVEIVEQ